MLDAFLQKKIAWASFSAADVVALRKSLNLTREGLAALLMVTEEVVERWESGIEAVPGSCSIALCALSHLGEGIFSLMEPGAESFALVPVKTVDHDLARGVHDPRFNLSVADKETFVPEFFTPELIRALRRRLRMNRREFADFIGISVGTAVNWEHGLIAPKGAALTLLKVLWIHGRKAFSFT